jgi:WD40 repeat protein
MAISGDGTMIVGEGVAGEIVVWDATTGEQVHQISTPTVGYNSMAFQPRAAIIAVGSSSGVHLWDPNRASLRSTVLLSDDDGFAVDYVSVSGNGKRAMAYGPYGSTVVVDLPTTVDGKPTAIGENPDLWNGRINADGTVIAGFVDESLEVKNVETGEPLAALGGDDLQFLDLEFSPDSDLLAVSVSVREPGNEEGSGQGSNEVWLWDYEADQVRARITDIGLDPSLSFSPDGALLTTPVG